MSRFIDASLLAAMIVSGSQLNAAEKAAVTKLQTALPFVTTVSDRELLKDFIENNLDTLSDDTLSALVKIAAKDQAETEAITNEVVSAGRKAPKTDISAIEFSSISSSDVSKAAAASSSILGRAHLIMNAYESITQDELNKAAAANSSILGRAHLIMNAYQ